MKASAAGLAIAAALVLQAATADAAAVVPSVCTRAIAAVERPSGIPDGVLMAIGFGEAGRKAEGGATVWPWTVNVAGEGHFFASKAEAVAFVRSQQAAGQSSIDIGCMQINLRWHPEAFATLEEGFEPARNVAYASRFLATLRERAAEPGLQGWMRAIGNYHSGDPDRAERYRQYIVRHWQKVAEPTILAGLAGGGDRGVADVPLSVAVASDMGADLFGRDLVAFWSTPFGALIGPSDGRGQLLDMEVRKPYRQDPATAEAPVAAPSARPARPARIRRFLPPPSPPPTQPVRPERRPGLLLQQQPS